MSSTPSQPEPTDLGRPAEPLAPVVPGAQTEARVPAEPVTSDTPAPEVGPVTTADRQVAIPTEGTLSDAEIAAIAASAQPATIRRAPRYKGFFWTGALVGIALGVLCGLGLSYDGMVNRWIYVVVTVLGTTLVTVLLAGALAALADKRGTSKAAKQRASTAR